MQNLVYPANLNDVLVLTGKFYSAKESFLQKYTNGKNYRIVLFKIKEVKNKANSKNTGNSQRCYKITVKFSLKGNAGRQIKCPEFLKIYFYNYEKELITVLGKMYVDMGGTKTKLSLSLKQNNIVAEFAIGETLFKKTEYFLAVLGDSKGEVVAMSVPDCEIKDS